MPRRLDHALEDVIALPSRGIGEIGPSCRFTIAGEKPLERVLRRCGLPRRHTREGDAVFRLELGRAEIRPDPNSKPATHADLPDRLAVAGDLSVQVWRARARH